YYFYLGVFGVMVLGFGYAMRNLPAGPNPLGVFADLLILPAAFYTFGTFNPPGWTIGAELLFYLVLPFLLVNRAILLASALVAAVVWTAAMQGHIDAEFYGYRMLPGSLVFFLIGVAIQRGERGLFAALVALFVVNGLALLGNGHFDAWHASL